MNQPLQFKSYWQEKTKDFTCIVCDEFYKDTICFDEICPACRKKFLEFKKKMKQKITSKEYQLSKDGKIWEYHKLFSVKKMIQPKRIKKAK